MALPSMAADSGGLYEALQLEPFIHQVGGHSSMLQLDDETICKPLISQELNFYKSAPDSLREFMAEYKGVIEVTFSEAIDGHIDVVTYLPANYKTSSSKPGSRQNSITECERKAKHRIKLCQSGNIKIESVTGADDSKAENIGQEKLQNGSLPNPWVLHCHQKQMQKMRSDSNISQKYILLENRVSKYEFPCILDIKMGTRQYGDTAPPAKRQSQTVKAATSTSPTLGVRISGMQVYHRESKHYICHNKYYGHRLNVDGFHKTLYKFLHDGTKLRYNIITALLEKLHKLYSTVQNLNTFRFFTSSLLIIYNGSEQCCVGNENNTDCEASSGLKLTDNGNIEKNKKLLDSQSKSCDKCSVPSDIIYRNHVPQCRSKFSDHVPLVDLCMIDFAHATHNQMPNCPFKHDGPDEGYLFGLKNLIAHLEIIQQSEK
ncbi:inositol hexakisphosphate kinase 1 isoform X1 [Parasteatoda tepidariorum]|uniref:inositol hexakisphosphate kinase 1 isoform X2 n=1 Tax=Parasteatoda tepidariorum TaxID=114398 RepID=UPI00077F9DB3|nr:inositol hexakisphosphate kinase 1 isoform X1 [Parasteatoda tepidariorum]XP_015911687.1 inositol hexakisphosphate kinase 1 isoform X1 [Parasteatoda tepidariorum]XP_042898084.1 inositol hexakisphosphate kinase 1 isoform X2 [Parasteatoda tepidariorum]